MYAIIVYGTRFNWENIIMAALKSNIFMALALDEGVASEFYMASYLLDAVCVRRHFEGWAHNWIPENGGPIINVSWCSGIPDTIKTWSPSRATSFPPSTESYLG